MQIAIASRAPDKKGRAWVVRVQVSTVPPSFEDVSRHYTYAEANEARRDLQRR